MSDHVRAGTASGAGADLATAGAGFARAHRSLRVDAHWLLGAVAAAAIGLASNTAGAADPRQRPRPARPTSAAWNS